MSQDSVASDSQNATSTKVYDESAKQIKILIDKNIANINPLTKIVEPAFNKFTTKPLVKHSNNPLIDLKSLRTGRTEIKLSKAQEKEMQEKLETHLISTISGIDKDKFNEEKLAFVKELEDQYHQSNLQKENKDQEAKKGRKLRKEYTLPPKPIKGMPFYQMESKKYEAAKYYLLNQNSTTLSKTCKQFKVSVPTLITYMDKDRVEAYLKTGKYSGTAAKRERRNVKNQYKEKEQISDKWFETIKTLINDTPGSEEGTTILDTAVPSAEPPSPIGPELTKKEAIAAHHLEESKRVMNDAQVKFHNLRTLKAPKRKPNGKSNKGMKDIINDPAYNKPNKVFLPPIKINKKNSSMKDVKTLSPSFQQNGNLMHLANLSSMHISKNQGVSAQGFGILSLDSNQQIPVDRGYVNFSRPGSNYFNNNYAPLSNGYKVPPLTAGSNVGYSGNDPKNDITLNNQRPYFLNGGSAMGNIPNNKSFPFLPMNSKSSTLLSAGSALDPIESPIAGKFQRVEGSVGNGVITNNSLESRQSLTNLNAFNLENKPQGNEYYGVENIYDSVKNIPESNDRNEKVISPKEDVVQKIEKQYVDFDKTSAGSFAFTPPDSGSSSKNTSQPEYY